MCLNLSPGLVANFHLTDAYFQPKIARYQASSRQFAATATRNDILSDTAVAYLELLRAERRLAIAQESREKTIRIADLTGAYARTGQGSAADHDRLLAEVASRDNEITQAEEAVQTASPRLAFLIHSDPSVLLGLSYGGFSGGLGNSFANGSDRFDADAIAYWELRNLGFGEQAARGEAASKMRQARMREVVVLDRVAQEVVESYAQVIARRKRIEVTKPGIVSAERSYDLNLERIENARGLPIEALQSVQALAQARREYLNAIIDHNIAQIRLCRATGWFEEIDRPAQE